MSAAIVGPELLILLVLIIPALGIWVAIDAGTKPQWAFDRAGQNKTLWIALALVGIFLCGIVTIVTAVLWFSSIRPKVIAAASSGFAATPGWSGSLPPQGQPLSPDPFAANPGAPQSLPVPAQWSRDPLGRHELRYWNGSAWTEHVSDAGAASTDPV